MTADDFRRLATQLDGVVERSHMGHPDFRAADKIFATLHADMRTGMVKLTPEQQARVIREHPAAFAPESGAWGRSGCTRVLLAAAAEETLGEALTIAWQNVMAARSAKRPRATRTARPVAKPRTR